MYWKWYDRPLGGTSTKKSNVTFHVPHGCYGNHEIFNSRATPQFLKLRLEILATIFFKQYESDEKKFRDI